MLSDHRDRLPLEDPRARGDGGVVIIQASVSRIPAVHRVAGGVVCRFVGFEVDLPVVHRGKGALLIDDACHRVGELRALDAVDDDRADGDLPRITLSPALGVDRLCHEVEIGRSIAVHAALLPLSAAVKRIVGIVHAERSVRRFADDPVGGQPVLLLERDDRPARSRAEDAVDRARIVAPVFEAALHFPHLSARAPLPEHGGLDGDERRVPGRVREDRRRAARGCAAEEHERQRADHQSLLHSILLKSTCAPSGFFMQRSPNEPP